DPTVESRLVSAITGKDLDEGALNHIGERVCNLQRAILLREGWGGRSGDRLPDFVHDEPLGYVFFNPDLTVPGRDGEVVSRRGARLDRADFEKMKDEYYALRGWDIPSGLPKRMKLEELGLTDVADELEKRKLLR
ncbi:MAG: aldehyde ferredoxin oxidoreductase C-terminal domain-containing protein, partial [Dehalococcoidales bacterium]|nr:aldehyde ferredoxin oxidoreductase C-terminal domain-containing protein [Dehalococcoidales bacterium]